MLEDKTYSSERTEQDLYDCAVKHYTIEKISNYWRFKTRYKDYLIIELSDKDLEKDKLALADIIVKVRMKINYYFTKNYFPFFIKRDK